MKVIMKKGTGAGASLRGALFTDFEGNSQIGSLRRRRFSR